MKVITVNSGQFNLIWNKLQPQQRITGNLPHPAMVMSHINTLILLDDNLEFGSISNTSLDDQTLHAFVTKIINRDYDPISSSVK